MRRERENNLKREEYRGWRENRETERGRERKKKTNKVLLSLSHLSCRFLLKFIINFVTKMCFKIIVRKKYYYKM